MFKIVPKPISAENYELSIDKWQGVVDDLKSGYELELTEILGACGFCAEYGPKNTDVCFEVCPLGSCFPEALDKSIRHANGSDFMAAYEATGNPYLLIWAHDIQGNREKMLEAAEQMLAVIKTFEPYVY